MVVAADDETAEAEFTSHDLRPESPVNRRLGEIGPNTPINRAIFTQEVRQYFSEYAQFKGYASRSEYWWV